MANSCAKILALRNTFEDSLQEAFHMIVKSTAYAVFNTLISSTPAPQLPRTGL